MVKPILIKKDGKEFHISVGAIIKKDEKFLLVDRNLMPFGFAAIAGHVDEGEEKEKALVREVKEETNLDVKKFKLLFNGESKYPCVYKFNNHTWHIYECEVEGKLKGSKKEVKSIGYFSKEEINKLYKDKKLEPIWETWFKKLGVINE